MNEPNQQSCKLSRTTEGLVYNGDTLTYRITGLSPHNLDRLRVTLKANPADQPTTFHIDTLDLYFSRAREGFAESCAKYLKAQQSIVMAELSLLIAALEAERVAMREKGNTAAVPPMSDEEKKEALDTLKSKDLLKTIVSDFDGIGYIGEKVTQPCVSPETLRAAVHAFTMQQAVPSHSIRARSYRDQNAKVLAIEEEDGRICVSMAYLRSTPLLPHRCQDGQVLCR